MADGLHHDRLIGRVDPKFDRQSKRLVVNAVYAEDGAPSGAGRRIASAIADLARWLGADRIDLGERLADPAPALRRMT